MRKRIKRLFCKHKFIRKSFINLIDKKQNIKRSKKLYVCEKCGKRKWIDSKNDPYLERIEQIL